MVVMPNLNYDVPQDFEGNETMYESMSKSMSELERTKDESKTRRHNRGNGLKDIRLILLNKRKGCCYDTYRRYYTNSEKHNCCIN